MVRNSETPDAYPDAREAISEGLYMHHGPLIPTKRDIEVEKELEEWLKFELLKAKEGVDL